MFNSQFGGPICVTVPNFAEIGQTVPIFNFSRWRPSAILDLFYACWDHPRRVLGGLCDCAKFGCNRCSNFDSMQILIFCTLSLKMPIHAPKIGVFGGFYQYASPYQISRRSVEPFRRYGRFSIFFKMAAVRHLGFVMRVWGPPTKGIWWSLSLCKIWLELMQ